MKPMPLNIFGQKWKVVRKELDPGLSGLCIFDKRTIIISEQTYKQGPQAVAETLFHEILHAAFYRLRYYQGGIDGALEEILVDQLAAVLADNLKLIKSIRD